jgi:hypothetical protein
VEFGGKTGRRGVLDNCRKALIAGQRDLLKSRDNCPGSLERIISCFGEDRPQRRIRGEVIPQPSPVTGAHPLDGSEGNIAEYPPDRLRSPFPGFMLLMHCQAEGLPGYPVWPFLRQDSVTAATIA